MDFKSFQRKQTSRNSDYIEAQEARETGGPMHSSSLIASPSHQAPGTWNSPQDSANKQDRRPRIQFKSHKLTLSPPDSSNNSPSHGTKPNFLRRSEGEPQLKKLSAKEFVMHMSTQMLRRSLDRVDSILPKKYIPDRSVTQHLPLAVSSDPEGTRRVNLKVLDTLQMQHVGGEDPSVLGGSIRLERSIASPDNSLKRMRVVPQLSLSPGRGGGAAAGGEREVSTAPAGMRGAGRQVMGTSSRQGSRLQSRPLPLQQASSPSFLTTSSKQQQQQIAQPTGSAGGLNSSPSGLSHFAYFDRDHDALGLSDDDEDEEGEGMGMGRGGRLGDRRLHTALSMDKNQGGGMGGGGNLLYQTMFMSLPKIESPKTTKGFLHKMRKPGKKKENLAVEASLVDRSHFFDHTADEFEAEGSEMSSEATDLIFPPSIVLGGSRPSSRFSRPGTSTSLHPNAPLLTSESDLYYMASHLGIISNESSGNEEPAYSRTPGVLAGGSRGASSPDTKRSRSPSKGMNGMNSVPPSPLGGPPRSPMRNLTRGSKSGEAGGLGGLGPELSASKSIKSVTQDGQQGTVSRTPSGREMVTNVVERVSSAISLGLKIIPDLNMTQKTRETTHAYAASVTQVQNQGVSLKLLQRIVDMLPDHGMSTGEMVQSIVMKETRHLKCRYTDTVANPELVLGPAQYYISHSWKCCFVDLVDIIAHFVSTRVPRAEVESTFVWLDCFCVNQHPPDGRFIPPFVDLLAMKEVISSCEKTLLVLDKDGTTLLQTGSLWDIWLTSNLDKMDKGRLIPLSTHWDWESLEASFSLMDVINSTGGHQVWGSEHFGRERDRKVMVGEMTKSGTGAYSGDSVTVTGELKDFLLNGAKRELQRATNYTNVSPRWLVLSANATAMILYLRRQYSDAEETLRQAVRIIEKANPKSIPDVEIVATKLHQSLNCMAKGSINEAENICQEVIAKFDQLRGHEMFIAIMVSLGSAMCNNGNFTRGERMVQKALSEIENNMGKRHPFYSSTVLLLSSLAASQKLCKQAGEGSLDVLELCVRKYPDLQGSDQGPSLGLLLQYLRGGGAGLIPKAVYKMFMPSAKAQQSFTVNKSQRVKPIPIAAKDDPGKESHETFVQVEILTGGEEVDGREHEMVLLEVAAALHVLAFSQSSSNRLDAAYHLVGHSVYLRRRILVDSHPLTLESLLLQAQILIKLEMEQEALEIMVDVESKMTRVLGPDHVDTLLCLGDLADLRRALGQSQEASMVEKKIMEAGSSLLLHTKVLDKVRNVAVVCLALASREHLMEKAALVMAKVLIVYRERLGNEHKLTKLTRRQLSEILERVKVLGSKALQDAFSGIATDENYKVAEVMYRQALVVEQVIDPDSDQSSLMEGLVEAQFGQGKTHDAQKTMRAWRMMPQQVAKGKDALPTSYLRWLNKDK